MASAVLHLKRRSDYLRVARQGSAWSMPGLVLQMRQRTQQDSMGSGVAVVRVGITATRKLGGAVVRNRVRRRLRALATMLLPDLGRAGCDYVLIGRASTAGRAHPQLCNDFRVALAKLHDGRGRPSRGAGIAAGDASPAGDDR